MERKSQWQGHVCDVRCVLLSVPCVISGCVMLSMCCQLCDIECGSVGGAAVWEERREEEEQRDATIKIRTPR